MRTRTVFLVPVVKGQAANPVGPYLADDSFGIRRSIEFLKGTRRAEDVYRVVAKDGRTARAEVVRALAQEKAEKAGKIV